MDSRISFTKTMKKDYTILIPDMASIHFKLLKSVLKTAGYNVEILRNEGPSVIEEGLKYVHNDTCYPALLVIGQMIDALNSDKYDLNKTALLISQTGGGCRASNYLYLLRKSLKKAGLEHIPVISFNVAGLEKNSGFKLTLPLIRKLIVSIAYGDLLMLLDNQVKAYEVKKGESSNLVDSWIEYLRILFNKNKGYRSSELKTNFKMIAKSFSDIPIYLKEKTKVGIVGEIYVKYSKLANNHLEEFLHEEDCEVMVPGLMNFLIFTVDSRLEDIIIYGGSKFAYKVSELIKKALTNLEDLIIQTVKKYTDFHAPSPYEHLKLLAKDIIGYGCKMGEGWILTAEMIDLIRSGYENIVCAQPFGCLPNHIVGKGMIRKIRGLYENANIVPIDYDPGATKVNQENRIKLMLAIAKENLIYKDLKEKQEPVFSIKR